MRERGTVVSAGDGIVDVAIEAKPDCETCGACAEGAAGTRLLEGAVNTPGARVGDLVEVDTPAAVRMRAQGLVYVFPVVSLLLGYLAGSLLGTMLRISPDQAGAAFGIAAGALALASLRRFSGAFERSGRQPRVRAIIARGQSGKRRFEP